MELSVLANDGNEVAVQAIVIDFLIYPLDDNYRDKLLGLAHLKNLNLLAHPYTGEIVSSSKNFFFSLEMTFTETFGNEKPIRG